ncbi:alpha/beta hydrolase [Teredinibacter sp. KSP-S5-2]|uniref:alpha/beta hydrolase n=1 Tax=Teredinibacter sp. KSP-S5-2 TaxID=3034506 RepID=UPI002934D412|nr:alpha/beta fold hydrolase [Teredinibacter sp. KSP-S5-2]WNO09199.1 alpha/beta hydrolase [Teredinibacter sp. KSP-S5-2]
MKNRKVITFIAYLWCFAILGSYSVWNFGSRFITPVNQPISQPESGVEYEKVVISSASGTELHGWLFPGNVDMPVIAVFHGIGSNKGKMLPRVKLLSEAGYTVVVVDFSAHGESIAEKITFGKQEAQDVDATIKYIRSRFAESKIGVIGISMGGAATLLSESKRDIDALIIEGVYAKFIYAVRNRMALKLGILEPAITPLMVVQLEPRAGARLDELQPITQIKEYQGALYVLGGKDDMKTKEKETLSFYKEANEPKQLWIVDGAKHEDLYNFDSQKYSENVLRFFQRFLLNEEISEK